MILFCSYAQTKKPVAADYLQQRAYIYGQLQACLKDLNFALMLPINQTINAAAAGIPWHKNTGFCHGYGENWADVLTDKKFALPGFEWDRLMHDQDYNLPDMVNFTQTQTAQKTHNCKHASSKKNYNHAKFYYTTTDLIAAIVARCFMPQTENMFVIEIAKLPSYQPICTEYLLIKKPCYIKYWHEMRLFIDDQQYVHWFDANIGWFRSSSARPSVESVVRFLGKIFAIMQYENYHALAITNSIHILRNGVTWPRHHRP